MAPYLPAMSCTTLTADQRRVLDLLAQGQPVPEDLVSVMVELVQWGWALRSGELTGVGWAHAGEVSRGVLGGDGDQCTARP